ncbi:hypothetical protein [Leptolyngbya sp. FACHB-261]|uniref:hypothetical protein n=1 Tax=Leptolyngbya sp. FACHB-261 TaxID=2692806 RepID=UPI0016879C37|nr:hypothetical protein [Leptolyngbya sp. FACHB-261]MBD2100032.1 hypothetical protein [Leptolyngbya sp. FACHB-261]
MIQKAPTPHPPETGFRAANAAEQKTRLQQLSENGIEAPLASAFESQEVVGLHQRPGERGKILCLFLPRDG